MTEAEKLQEIKTFIEIEIKPILIKLEWLKSNRKRKDLSEEDLNFLTARINGESQKLFILNNILEIIESEE